LQPKKKKDRFERVSLVKLGESTLKLAFSTNAFTKISLFDALEMIRDIGYGGAEIMADDPHVWPMESDPEVWESVREKAFSLELELCNINAFMMKKVGDIHHPSWIERDPALRELRHAHTRAALRMAGCMKVPRISTEPGGPLEGMDRDEAIGLYRSGLSEVLPSAEEAGVKLLIEPEPALLLEGLEETLAFIEQCGSPHLGVNFDAGHFFCIGLDPADMVLAFPEHLEHIHIEDIAANREHRHLIPGLGAMDFKRFFSALHRVGYEGFVTVELYPYEEEPERAAREAHDFLMPFLKG
jgi:sugar phosphate isomerase/epimerase